MPFGSTDLQDVLISFTPFVTTTTYLDDNIQAQYNENNETHSQAIFSGYCIRISMQIYLDLGQKYGTSKGFVGARIQVYVAQT